MKLYKTFFIVFIFSSISLFAQNFTKPETRGVWVSGNYLKGGPAVIENVMKNLSSANFNVIFVDVWYQGATIYPSNAVENAGGPLQNPEFSGTDPLKTTIEIAHKYGIQVFAWFEYAFMVGHSQDSTNVPAILKKHPDWAMLRRDTTKNYFHNMYGYFFAIDPSIKAASDFSVSLYTECANKYPNIDGIESDIENDTAVSYSDTSRIRFMKETGNPDPLSLPADNQAWKTWRRLQITNVIQRIYEGVKSINPKIIVSAAVPPPYMESYMLESWDVWAKKGYVDMVEPMLYLPVGSFSSQLNLCKKNVPAGFKMDPGVDINSAGSVANTIAEIKAVKNNGIGGQNIWYYGYILSNPGIMTNLKSSLYAEKTAPDYDDLLIDNTSGGVFQTTGSWINNRGGYGSTFEKSTAQSGDTATYYFRILRSGKYSLFGIWAGDSVSNTSQALIKINSKTLNKVDTLNQKTNLNQWNFVDQFNLNSGDTVTIKVCGNDGATLIADAFRLKRGNFFKLTDYAVPDSQNVLLKFSNNILTPVSSSTKITSASNGDELNFNIDQIDHSVIHIDIPSVQKKKSFQINISGLIDILHDTLNTQINIVYNPDSTDFSIDDQNSKAFWELTGKWINDTSYTAVGDSFQIAKQTSNTIRAQWGPLKILKDGYYDVSVNIPKTNLPLAGKCIYMLHDHFKVDSIIVAQNANSGQRIKLGSFYYKANDQFALLLSSSANADTSKYLAADEISINRVVDITSVNATSNLEPENFIINQNYPNPFNPNTTITFVLIKNAKVYIDIYNSLGQKVENLVAGKTYAAGNWKVNFNASSLSSGVYFALLRIKGQSFSGRKVLKMVLLK